MRSFRKLSLLLIVSSPALLAAKGCHFGNDDVSLGENGPDDPQAGNGGSSGRGGGAGRGGSTGVAGSRVSTAGQAGAGVAGRTSSSGGDAGAPDSGGSSSAQAGSVSAGTGAGAEPGQGGDTGEGGVPSSGSGGIAGTSPDAGSGGNSGGGSSGAAGTTGSGDLPHYGYCATRASEVFCDPSSEPRYQFNDQTMVCERADWDCSLGPTTYPSLEECTAACAIPDPPVTSAGEFAGCILPPSSGACMAGFTRYFFDPRTDRCETFTYSGCIGNRNHFQTLAECESACVVGEDNSQSGRLVQGGGCAGLGLKVTDSSSAGTFTLEGTVLKRAESWGCGCPDRPEWVMTYTPLSPVTLQLCHDELADPCEASCQAELSWDLAAVFEDAGTTEFVFSD